MIAYVDREARKNEAVLEAEVRGRGAAGRAGFSDQECELAARAGQMVELGMSPAEWAVEVIAREAEEYWCQWSCWLGWQELELDSRDMAVQARVQRERAKDRLAELQATEGKWRAAWIWPWATATLTGRPS